MRYRYAKIKKNNIEFTLAEKHGNEEDGIALNKLIDKHDPMNKNVLLVKKKSDGLNELVATDLRKMDYFRSTENFDNLKWIESFVE